MPEGGPALISKSSHGVRVPPMALSRESPDLYWRSEPPKEDDEVYANSFRPWLPNPFARVELLEQILTTFGNDSGSWHIAPLVNRLQNHIGIKRTYRELHISVAIDPTAISASHKLAGI